MPSAAKGWLSLAGSPALRAHSGGLGPSPTPWRVAASRTQPEPASAPQGCKPGPGQAWARVWPQPAWPGEYGAGPRRPLRQRPPGGRRAHRRPCGARALARRFLRPLAPTARRAASVPAGESVAGVEPPERPHRPHAGHRAQALAGGASCCWALVTLESARAVSRPSSSIRASATARRCGTAGAAQRAAPPARWAVSALCVPLSGTVDGRGGGWPGAKSAARLRLQGRRRRPRSRGARLAAGEPEACGSRPSRSRPAILGASLWSFWACPPCIACIARACPRPKAIPAGAQRAASPSQGTRPATAPPSPSRSGALAVRNGAGAAFLGRCHRRSPAWRKTQTSRARACQSRPPDNGGW
jgi:hypothetical protein